MNALNKVRREIMSAVKKNREKANTNYIKLLSTSLAHSSNTVATKSADYLDYISNIREYDVPYHVRVSIDFHKNSSI